jgi:hypothetical protein
MPGEMPIRPSRLGSTRDPDSRCDYTHSPSARREPARQRAQQPAVLERELRNHGRGRTTATKRNDDSPGSRNRPIPIPDIEARRGFASAGGSLQRATPPTSRA